MPQTKLIGICFLTLRGSARIAFAWFISATVGKGACARYGVITPSVRPMNENICPNLKSVLPSADLALEGYVYRREALRDEGPFGDHHRSPALFSMGRSGIRPYRKKSNLLRQRQLALFLCAFNFASSIGDERR